MGRNRIEFPFSSGNNLTINGIYTFKMGLIISSSATETVQGSLNIASGGTVTFQTGSQETHQSGSSVLFSGTASVIYGGSSTIEHSGGTTETWDAGAVATFNDTPTFSAGLTFGGATLSSYNEGTWTPVLSGSSGIIGAYAASVAVGLWRRIGKIVTASFRITLTNAGSWTGTTLLSGFPFAGSASLNQSGNLAEIDNVTFVGQLGLVLPSGASAAILVESVTGIAAVSLPYSGISNSATLIGSITYCTDT